MMFDFGIVSVRQLTRELHEIRVRRGFVGSLGYYRSGRTVRWI